MRDKQGRKFSKSLGNGVDPLKLIEQYGADALRIGLLTGTAIGNDITFDENKIRGYKHFSNKLWNISRFVFSNTEGLDTSIKPMLTEADQKRLKELSATVTDITTSMEKYRLDLAADTIYHYVWHTFADVIIEKSKTVLNGNDEAARRSTQWMLHNILSTSLKLLHPFMPFITEELWQCLELTTNNQQQTTNLLMIQQWPK